MNKRNKGIGSLSKFISLILRHKPESINETLDNEGYIEVDKLIEGINNQGKNIDFDLLCEIVASDEKQRYSFNEDKTKIRANQGHSVKVDVGLKEIIPPEILYHGTATRFLDSILEKGLIPSGRLYVHLSSDVDTAIKVGKRHGDVVILKVDTVTMLKDGYKFYISENKVYLTEKVPSKYLSIIEK